MQLNSDKPQLKQTQALLLARTRLLVFGAITILAIVLAMMALWITSVSQNSERLQDIVERQTQTRLLATMLYAIQQRSLVLHQMSDLVDPFEQDDKYLEFRRFGSLYLVQRENLLATGLSEVEKYTLNEIDSLANYGGNMQEHVANLIMQGLAKEAKEQLETDVANNQSQLVDKLRSIFESQRNYVESELQNATQDQKNTYWFIIFFSTAAIVLGVFTGLVLKRNVKSELRTLKQNQWIHSLYQISSSSKLSLEDQVNETLELGRQLLNMEIGQLCQLENNNSAVSITNMVDAKNEIAMSNREIPLDKTFCKFLLNKRSPICIPDTHNTDNDVYDCYEYSQSESWIGIPLYVNKSQFGSVNFLSSKSRNNLSEEDINLIKLIANWISVIKEKQLAQQDNIARETAEIANQTKSIFLANMSHELRTPLHAILGYNELLKDEIIFKNHHEHLRDIEKIDAAGKHLLSLINDVLDLSKIEAGKMDVNTELFSLRMLLDEVKATVAPLVTKNQNILTVSLDDNLDSVNLDLIKVRQILLNLIGNSAKFTRNGSIQLFASSKHVNGKDYLQFIVKDNGIGMTADQLENIFVAFSQAAPQTQYHYGGTGLGLAITNRLCQIMEGSIAVESMPDIGTTFTVQLPFINEESDSLNNKTATG